MDITIEKLIYGGEGLAHQDGATVFVPFVLPGEQVAAVAVEQKKKFVRARLEEIRVSSPERTSARCPHFTVCGGCSYQHIPYEFQIRYKTQILRETLRRLGRVEWPGDITVHPSPPWGYRNRAQWKVRPLGERDSGSAAEPGGTSLGIGYFRANSTALCAVEDCAILSPLLLKTLLRLREIEAFADSDDSSLLLTATFAGFPPRAKELAEAVKAAVPETESLLFYDSSRERMELFGPGFLTYEVAGRRYRVGHFSFFQVNRFLVPDMVANIVEQEPGGRLALDLFAGVGLFSVPLARKFERVVAVESNPAAARDLKSNVQGDGRVEDRNADVERFLDKYKGEPELVIVNPPRAGLTPGVVQRLGALAPDRIIYVSCEPPTLARDLAALHSSGYDPQAIQLFDLFPQTFHMEAVVRLRRRQ
jgi:23S rRNA (uracil1939-C5)-methyltransferase